MIKSSKAFSCPLRAFSGLYTRDSTCKNWWVVYLSVSAQYIVLVQLSVFWDWETFCVCNREGKNLSPLERGRLLLAMAKKCILFLLKKGDHLSFLWKLMKLDMEAQLPSKLEGWKVRLRTSSREEKEARSQRAQVVCVFNGNIHLTSFFDTKRKLVAEIQHIDFVFMSQHLKL